jgi:hypothetical protein
LSSSAKLNGQTGILKLDLSDACHFESTGETASAYAELSGASKANLTVTGEQSRSSKLSLER